MKVIVSESNLGIEYVADVISSCEQNGIECIVDDNSSEILYYDPKNHKYSTDREIHNADTSIHELFKDKAAYDTTMSNAEGDKFKEFAVKWNGLQKKDDGDEVFKTKHCNPIRGNFSESLDNEGEVEIMWDTDAYEDFGIFKGDCSTYLIDYDRVDTHDDLLRVVCMMISKEYPDLDFESDDFTIVNEREFWGQREQNMVYPYDESEDERVEDEDFSTWTAEDIPEEMTFDEGAELYQNLYDAYYDHKLNYSKFDVLRNKLVDSVVVNLLGDSSIEDLAKEWFKDYGTRNGWDWKTSFDYRIADTLHSIHMKKHPDEHRRLPQRNNWRGWHEDNCSCGLCSSCDSSD